MQDTGKLGFGMMRLPRRGVRIDVKQVCQMVDAFMEAGFTYFDTARIYPGSETATHKALVKRYPRDSFTIATKLNTMVAPTAKMARKQIDTSLRNLGCDYVDHYLLHSLMGANYKSYDNLGLWDFVGDLKRQGKVRHAGFSFHGGPQLLDQILTDHPEVDFVQLQLNYADWENPRITARANYEIARSHDVPIVVMEPVKGGKLANPPQDVRALMERAAPGASPASWAIRFAAGLDGVACVLSGMSNMQQVEDNVAVMRDFRPLDAAEMQVIRHAQEALGNSREIPCTACRYCVEGCPVGIPIPETFAAMNLLLAGGSAKEAQATYRNAIAGASPASACISCGRCESACPQHIDVITQLRESAAALEA